jgi:poly-gamma-glutamate capsule biosynthesis protein CapA/YwtB (metallophosphatase superfamily)
VQRALLIAGAFWSALAGACRTVYPYEESGGSEVVYREVETLGEPAHEDTHEDLKPREYVKKTLVIRAVGDIMLGSTYPHPDGRDLPPESEYEAGILGPLSELLRGADLTFGNLEGVLLDAADARAKPKCNGLVRGCFAFRMPPSHARWLEKTGFDMVSIANNHILDFGERGRDSTIAHLEEVGIAWSGPTGTVARREVSGLRVSMIAFSVYDGLNDMNRIEAAMDLISKEARASEVLIVSFHGGGEGLEYERVREGPEFFLGRNRGDLRKFSRAAVDAGADLVLGHGPHVARGIEIHRERLIAYSLGNFATWKRFDLSGARGLGMVLEVTLGSDGRFISGHIHPVKQEYLKAPVEDRDGAVIARVSELSSLDFPDSVPGISSAGFIERAPARNVARNATPESDSRSMSQVQTVPPLRGEDLLEPLHPELQRLARVLHSRAAADGIHFRVIHGHAPYEKRKRPGPGGMANWHQFGLAFDVLLEGRRGLGDSRQHFEEDDSKWRRLGEIAAELGLVWGGIWRSYDPFHFEWHPGDDALISAEDLKRFLRLAGPRAENYRAVWKLYPGRSPHGGVRE